MFAGCKSLFRSQQGRTYHFRTFHLNNNLVEEVDVQANVPCMGEGVVEDADFEMGEDNRLPDPAPGPIQENRAMPSTKCHPYLTGNVCVVFSFDESDWVYAC